MILAVPNVAEGRDFELLDRLATVAGSGSAELLDWSSDLDHNRSVFTLAGSAAELVGPVVSLASALMSSPGIGSWRGLHPTVGMLDVAPFVWLSPEDRGEAESAAIEAARRLGEMGIPVFLYGPLATVGEGRERAWFRRGGAEALAHRVAEGEIRPDFGPALLHPVMGATLVTARPPLVAFNVEMEGGGEDLAREIASLVRESGGGIEGVRAIGLELSTGRIQVSTNVEQAREGVLAEVVSLISRLASERGTKPVSAELIGLCPEAALVRYPEEVPIRDFDPDHQVIERRLGRDGSRGAGAR